ncbi:unnamed protein product [Ectocarpus sp. CCAP 1310/34]|nr:unnamed protein product [Ectocarpus sp. CCAP 1310/34]
MERERSKGERREVELALAASGMGQRGGRIGGHPGVEMAVRQQLAANIVTERRKVVTCSTTTPADFAATTSPSFTPTSSVVSGSNCGALIREGAPRNAARAAAAAVAAVASEGLDRRRGQAAVAGDGDGRAERERAGRGPEHARSGHGREQAYVVYDAHDDGGYYEDYGDYDDGYYYDDGYHDAGYAHYAGGGDSYSVSSGLTISQQTFTDELAAEYGVVGGRSVPMSSGVKLSDFDADEVATEFPFRELVGSLMWLATQTRPDIANAVRAVARYCASPKLVHWNAAMDILGYARRTSHFGISFQRGTVEGLSLQGYADADFASKAADRRSVSGEIVACGAGAVSWFSRTQKCVTLSTTEAEYVALGDEVKEILLLRQIWRFMLPQVDMPCIYLRGQPGGDSTSAEPHLSQSLSRST